MTKSNNVAIEANKVEISTNQTNINNSGYGYPSSTKPRLGLVDIDKIRNDISSEDEIEKELGVLSTLIESQSKYGRKYCLFTSILNVDQFAGKVHAGGYNILKLDDKTILVRW